MISDIVDHCLITTEIKDCTDFLLSNPRRKWRDASFMFSSVNSLLLPLGTAGSDGEKDTAMKSFAKEKKPQISIEED